MYVCNSERKTLFYMRVRPDYEKYDLQLSCCSTKCDIMTRWMTCHSTSKLL